MAEKTKLWYLENFNLLEGLTADEMKEVNEKTVMVNAKKNQFIYFPDDPSKSLFFLKEGRVKIGNISEDGRETIKAILQPGEIFGELSLAGQGQREDFAQALDTKVVICVMGIEDVENLIARNSNMGLKVTKLIGLRLKKMERRFRSLIFKDARTRIVDFLRDMADEVGKKVGDEILIKHPFTHQDIANLTASSRQTVTTVLNELKAANVINFERKRILIRDLALLK